MISHYIFFFLQAYHFDRHDVALRGLHDYFKKASDDERGHAEKLMKYQNKRGGTIVLSDIKTPAKHNWGTAKDAMIEALNLEKAVNTVSPKKRSQQSQSFYPNTDFDFI